MRELGAIFNPAGKSSPQAQAQSVDAPVLRALVVKVADDLHIAPRSAARKSFFEGFTAFVGRNIGLTAAWKLEELPIEHATRIPRLLMAYVEEVGDQYCPVVPPGADERKILDDKKAALLKQLYPSELDRHRENRALKEMHAGGGDTPDEDIGLVPLREIVRKLAARAKEKP